MSKGATSSICSGRWFCAKRHAFARTRSDHSQFLDRTAIPEGDRVLPLGYGEIALRGNRNMTKFGAMPFELNAEGKFVFGKVRQASSEIGARCLAAAMVATGPGAVVFCKTEGEPVLIVARTPEVQMTNRECRA
jgi:hypothetical protein